MKRFLGLMLVLITGVLLVGCNNSKINTISMFGGTDPNRETYAKLIAELEKAEGLTIKDNSSTADEEWKNSVIASFAAKQEPDVLHYFTGETAKPLVDNGYVVSIADIRKEFPDYAKILIQLY